MLVSETAQHRAKHLDLLLARELALIEREHEQNLLTQKHTEGSIRRELIRPPEVNRRKLAIGVQELCRAENQSLTEHRTRAFAVNESKDEVYLLGAKDGENTTDETLLPSAPRYRRHCTKLQRLPPIIKMNSSHRRPRQSNNDLLWLDRFQATDARKDCVHDALTKNDVDVVKITLPEITPTQKQIHLFIETLPKYTGTQRGFDNFGPSSLYSNRPPMIMK